MELENGPRVEGSGPGLGSNWEKNLLTERWGLERTEGAEGKQ